MVKSETKQRAAISVRGVVQGVGFRPFVYRLAIQHHLHGWVRNTSGRVEIEVEGEKTEIRKFLDEMATQAPPMALIEELQITYSSRWVTAISVFSKASPDKTSINSSPPTLPPAQIAGKRFLTLQTAVSAIPSPTAPIAVRGSQLSKIFHMTGRIRQCGILKCVPAANRNTMTR